MAQIKETVELLCKILKENGTSPVKSEIFRLSKFNNSHVVSVISQILRLITLFVCIKKIDRRYVEITI